MTSMLYYGWRHWLPWHCEGRKTAAPDAPTSRKTQQGNQVKKIESGVIRKIGIREEDKKVNLRRNLPRSYGY